MSESAEGSSRPTKRPRRRTPSPYRPQPGESNSTFVNEFFKHHIAIAEQDDDQFKSLELPLARIKKVMKSDPDVKMIASEVPVLFSKACEMFIAELTTRAWMVSDDAKRRTLTKADIAAAVERGDMFDFLIDIVPRSQELAPMGSKNRRKDSDRRPSSPSASTSTNTNTNTNNNTTPNIQSQSALPTPVSLSQQPQLQQQLSQQQTGPIASTSTAPSISDTTSLVNTPNLDMNEYGEDNSRLYDTSSLAWSHAFEITGSEAPYIELGNGVPFNLGDATPSDDQQ